MSCLITDGVGITCEALSVVGGVNKDFYMYNFDEFTSVGYDANNYVNLINFTTSYVGLHLYSGRKQAHAGGSTAQISGPGGNKFYQHDFAAKLFPDTPTEDQNIETLLVGCVGIIFQSNNDEFFLLGLKNGLDQSEQVQTSGQEPTTDISDSLVWTGAEPDKPKRIFVGGSALATKNYLDSLIV